MAKNIGTSNHYEYFNSSDFAYSKPREFASTANASKEF